MFRVNKCTYIELIYKYSNQITSTYLLSASEGQPLPLKDRRYHVTSGCGSPVTLHVSSTDFPSCTVTSLLENLSMICGAADIQDKHLFFVLFIRYLFRTTTQHGGLEALSDCLSITITVITTIITYFERSLRCLRDLDDITEVVKTTLRKHFTFRFTLTM